MEIGGYDHEIEPLTSEGWTRLVRGLLEVWPGAMVEDDPDDPAHYVTADYQPPPGADVVFFYRDARAARTWEEEGCTAENNEALLTVERAGLLVFGSPDSEVGRWVREAFPSPAR